MKGNVLELLVNSFHDFCDNKITFVYPNISRNKIEDIKRFFNRPIDETIAFFCDTHKDDGKRNILITEKGIYDKFDYQMFAFLGLSFGKVDSISHDYFFSSLSSSIKSSRLISSPASFLSSVSSLSIISSTPVSPLKKRSL